MAKYDDIASDVDYDVSREKDAGARFRLIRDALAEVAKLAVHDALDELAHQMQALRDEHK